MQISDRNIGPKYRTCGVLNAQNQISVRNFGPTFRTEKPSEGKRRFCAFRRTPRSGANVPPGTMPVRSSDTREARKGAGSSPSRLVLNRAWKASLLSCCRCTKCTSSSLSESGRLTQESRDRRSEIWDLILRVRNLNCCHMSEISENQVEIPKFRTWVRNLGPKFGSEIYYGTVFARKEAQAHQLATRAMSATRFGSVRANPPSL